MAPSTGRSYDSKSSNSFNQVTRVTYYDNYPNYEGFILKGGCYQFDLIYSDNPSNQLSQYVTTYNLSDAD